MRESIEASGRDARWEFSKAALFERTQHMAESCACLAGMVETVAGLYQFMGPQLKAVTGDPQVLVSVSVMCLMCHRGTGGSGAQLVSDAMQSHLPHVGWL